MKKALTLLTLLIGFNSFAIVCTSDDNPALKLKLTNLGGSLVEAESYARTVDQIFVGTVKYDFFDGDTYTLFNQKGEKSLFHLKKEVVFNHCRTRVCNNTPDPLKPSIGKLTVEGQEDEYFNCF